MSPYGTECSLSQQLLLELTDLRRTFDGGAGVYSISVRIPHGAIYALCGANGAGKTTTLSVLAGLLFAESGRLLLNGKIVPLHREARRPGLGLVPNDPYLDSDLTPTQWMDFVRDLRTPDNSMDPRDAAAALRLTEAELRTPIRELSFGTRRKVALLTEFVTTDALLLLDEPLIGLDPPSIAGFQDLATRFTADGRSILMSTHLLAEAEVIASHVGIVAAGRTISEGPLHELIGNGSLLQAFMKGMGAPSEAAVDRDS